MKKKSKKIIYVVNDADFFLSHRLPIARESQAKGYEIHVATPNQGNVAAIQKEGFIFHPISLDRKGGYLWKELSTFWGLYRLYRTIKPDLVHHVTIKPVLYGSITARLAKVPSVVNAITGLGYVFTARGVKAAFMRFSVKFLYRVALHHKKQVVIFQNPDDEALFLNNRLLTTAKPILIRGSGVDVGHFVPHPEQGRVPVIVLASRMLWDKGINEFIEAARLLRNAGVIARFVLVGNSDSGNPTAVPRSQLEAWNRSGTAEWWGYRKDMQGTFAQSHIVCLPTFYREGVPKVLIEAAACGRPIVTTDAPGCREIVRNGVNGYLVPPRDHVALASAILKLIEDRELRLKMGAKGREIAMAEFSVERVVNETLAVYEKLLS